jgi:molybdopterin-containing oxidoreductase family iron-sulfur binding subunit
MARRGVSRRDFLGLVAALAATAPACRRAGRERIVPYVRRSADVIPGSATTYATSLVIDGFATGLLVACREGRPIKVEGNPEHPASLGAAGPIEQASVLQLYDPDRATEVKLRGGPASWGGIRRVLADLRRSGGAGLRVLMPPTSSLLTAELMARVQQSCPDARFAFYSGAAWGNGRAGTRLMHGHPVEVVHDFSTADVTVALDSDFLAQGPFWLRYAHQWASRRNPGAHMGRLYCAETNLSVTGAMAEHRLPGRPSQVALVALQLGAEILAQVQVEVPAELASMLSRHRVTNDAWIHQAARDLARARGKGVIVVGDRQPAPLHALAAVLNRALNNEGRTVWTIPQVLVEPAYPMNIVELAAEMRDGRVKALLVLEGNPSYSAPADLDFGRLIRGVATTLYLGEYENETAQDAQWFVPAAHAFESWGDARALDGTVSFVQPLVAGLHVSYSTVQMLAALAEAEPPAPRDLVRRFWQGREANFEAFWDESLRAGVVRGSALAPVVPVERTTDLAALVQGLEKLAQVPNSYEINFVPDAGVHDGNFGNNAWLLEMPRPITKLCWGNAAFISPGMASTLGIGTGDVIELELRGRRLRVPAFVLPGHGESAVTLHLGWGRDGAERFARHVGVSAGLLRTSSSLHFAPGLTITRTGTRQDLVIRQLHKDEHDRPLALRTSAASYRKDRQQFAEHRGEQYSLIPAVHYEGAQWVMSIDLGLCIGCGSCVIACQAENNIPCVGADQVRRGRDMHWLRVDTYFSGPAARPRLIHQPLPCQHCERAPCEYVCPVNATVHSADGLNEMVYNRCVGTRFCSNNCPYKVRRFNWFNWYEREAMNQGSVRLQRNPEVTVRDRGVMEKCTYCVQRIRRAQITARLENREIRAGEVQTACQQACPTGAIAFGSLAHVDALAVQRRREPRAYELLHDQGTRPRTWYLARIDNPNPELG